ncbi:multidrug ABC transporter, ATP-binding protein and permease [Fictibacillus macauensis ZFHKF-1]|uniref:Multidrug ABC transporter, ATP-binding protein and permease n=1 Tax=Fictibacillus macauensis ZFHKF-1 TaxID=1196324 RepID=I8AJB5_9BACL|nr:ABC transporter transmembrane domain-containing protein [Fictibacillus macauensis]EIT85882.1 multidrug ABC transporter, ATP-binding protein and permease [Fictibacillus macauensis ZFHKF-1]
MFSVLYNLRWFFKKEWKRYSIAIGTLILLGVLEVIPPKLLGNVVDEIASETLSLESLTTTLWFYSGLLVVIFLLTYVMNYQLFGGAFLVERSLRSSYMKKLLSMTPRFYELFPSGDLMARGTNDLRSISVTAGFGIMTLVDSSIYTLVLFCTMGFLISWKLTLAAMIPLPLMAVAMSIYGGKVHHRFTESQAAFGAMNNQVLESVTGVRVIRAYVKEQEDMQSFFQKTEDVFQKNMKLAKIDALFEPTIKILAGFSYVIGLGYGAYLVFHNEVTLGELVTFNVYLGLMIWPMFAVGELINIMQQGNASLDRVNETMNYPVDVEEPRHPLPLPEATDLSFEHVTFRYPTAQEPQLKDVSIVLKKGETLGIVGKTGSGKSTFLKQILREYPLQSGKIRLSGHSIDCYSLEALHQMLGYVSQEVMLFSKTLQENITFGSEEINEQRLHHVIAMAAFEKDVQQFSHGLQTEVGERGVSLSGGQKQRIAIARALYVQPEILLLDDALSAVDAKTEATIIKHLREERKDKTNLIATHRLSAVMHANHIIVLEKGAIVEQGTHEQLLQQNGWYKEQYDRQSIEVDKNE